MRVVLGLAEFFIVEIRADLFGPFPSRDDADRWASAYGRTQVRHPSEIVSWQVRPVKGPEVSS